MHQVLTLAGRRRRAHRVGRFAPGRGGHPLGVSRRSPRERLEAVEGDARAAEAELAGVEGRPWFRWLARCGLGARGVIYAILSVLAFDVATHGSSPAATSGTGALEEVVRQPGGSALLVVLSAGLAGYGAWRLVQALSGRENPRRPRGLWVRFGWAVIAVIYGGLCAHAAELLERARAGAGTPQPFVAQVLRWPGGAELLGAAGVGLLIGGASLAAWGALHDYERELHLGRLPRPWRAVVRALGAAGDAARGFVVGLVGAYLLDSALADNPAQAKSVDLALRALVHTVAGPAIVGVVATGMACFALYSFCEAALRDL